MDGANVLDAKQDLNLLRAKIGMVFQKPTPFPMSIYDNVAYGIKLYEKAIDAYQYAVAIDEIRIAFPVTPMKSEGDLPNQVKEVWFPGEHGCVGGGTRETQGLSDAALEWMMHQVERVGLALDRSHVENGMIQNYKTDFDNSPQSIYKFMRTEWRKFTPSSRSYLHESATKRLADPNLEYDPPNLKDII